MKRLFRTIFATATILSLFLSFNLDTSKAESKFNLSKSVNDVEIMPYKAIIKWRYKMENGKLYKRLYNYTDECWVGEWELVG